MISPFSPPKHICKRGINGPKNIWHCSSTELEAGCAAAASVLLTERCNMWFSFARQLLDTSLAFCAHLPNPLLVSDPSSQHNTTIPMRKQQIGSVKEGREAVCLPEGVFSLMSYCTNYGLCVMIYGF